MSIKQTIKKTIFMLSSAQKQPVLFKEERFAFKELKQRVKLNNKLRVAIIISYIIGLFVFKFVFGAEINLLAGEVILFWMLFSTFFSAQLISRGTFNTFKGLNRFYFWWLAFDILWFGAIFYWLGWPIWTAIIIFTYYIAFSYFTFSNKQALFIFIESAVVYLTANVLELFSIVSREPFFDLGPDLYVNIKLMASPVLCGIIALYFSAQWSYAFSEKLKSRRAELMEAEEAKTLCQVKIRARTKELEELAHGLEGKVKARTQQLQQRIAELERFRRLTVGRELKMIELKKQIKQLAYKLKHKL